MSKLRSIDRRSAEFRDHVKEDDDREMAKLRRAPEGIQPSQPRPRRSAIRHYSTNRETVVEALERAHRSGSPIIARLSDDSSARVTLDGALCLLREGGVEGFAVMLDGREVPL